MRFILVLLLLVGLCGAADYGDINIRLGSNLSYVDGGGTTQTFDMETVPSSADGMVYNSSTSLWEILSLKYLSNEIVVGPSSDGYKSILYDYTTDGIDDQVQINAALVEANTSGQNIRALIGTYNCSDEIRWPFGGTYNRSPWLVGQNGRTVFGLYSGNGTLFNVTPTKSGTWYGGEWCAGGGIKNIKIDLPTYSGIGIGMAKVNFFTISDIRIEGGYIGIYNPTYDVYFCNFKNIEMASSGGGYSPIYGMRINTGGCVFDNVVIMNCQNTSLWQEGSGNAFYGGELESDGQYTANNWSLRDGGTSNAYMGAWIEGSGIYLDGKNIKINVVESSIHVEISKNAYGCEIHTANSHGIWDYSATTEHVPNPIIRYIGDEFWREYSGYNMSGGSELLYSVDAFDGQYGQISVRANAVDERAAWYTLYNPTFPNLGQWDAYVLLNASSAVADDCRLYIYDNEGTYKGYILDETFTPTEASTAHWYGPFRFNTTIDQMEGAYPDSLLMRCIKKTASANEIYIHALKYERVGPYTPGLVGIP